jgi:transposase-like protein
MALLSYWKSAFLERTATVFKRRTESEEQARVEELVRLDGKLTLENEILKRVLFFASCRGDT